MQFKKATKHAARLRLALIGVSGSGKTYTALTLAAALGQRVAVIDTEHGSASKYADQFAFDVLELDSFHPQNYVKAIQAAAEAGYDVVIADSLSHAWVGKDGALDIHDKAVDRSASKNTFTAWREVTPHHNALIEAIVQAPLHVIATMRAKTEYVVEEGGKKVRKLGLAPVQRDGMEYEFDVVGDIDINHTLVISKTRCPALADAVIRKPGADLAKTLAAWLSAGPAAPARDPRTPTSQPLPGTDRPQAEPPAQPEPQPSADPAAEIITQHQANQLKDRLAKISREWVALAKYLNYADGLRPEDLTVQQWTDCMKACEPKPPKTASRTTRAPAGKAVARA